MSCHNPLALSAVPPLQFHLAGLLQGMEAAGFTVPNAGGKGEQGLHWARHIQSSGSRAKMWAAEWKLWEGHGGGKGILFREDALCSGPSLRRGRSRWADTKESVSVSLSRFSWLPPPA